MENRKTTLIIVSIIALVLLSVGFSFTVTKNAFNTIEKQSKIVETTTYSIKIGSQLHKKKMSRNKTDTFLSVVESNKGILYKITNSYCQNRDDREDLIQEIIIQLWKSFDKYNNEYKHSTWIYRIALNVAISFYRKENRRKSISNPLPKGVLSYNNTPVLDETDEDIKFLQQFISGLKELDKALMLLYMEEKSYKEISEIIGISETNVATKIGRIKKLLKQKFSFIKNQ